MNMTRDEKLALLAKAFASEEGTKIAYRVAQLPIPERLALTLEGRVEDFQKAFLARYSEQ